MRERVEIISCDTEDCDIYVEVPLEEKKDNPLPELWVAICFKDIENPISTIHCSVACAIKKLNSLGI
jgi:hypothetical protein